VLQSYKKAHDCITNTGSGLHGIEFSNYQDKMVRTHCRFYFALKPILGQRPNVKPWYTNEQGDKEEQANVDVDSDDESVDSTDDGNVIDIQKEIDDIMAVEHGGRNEGVATSTNIGSKRSQVINLSLSDDSGTGYNRMSESSDDLHIDTSSLSGESVSRRVQSTSSTSQRRTTINTSNVSSISTSTKSKLKSPKKKVKLSPSEALSVQQSLLKKGVKQIHGTANKSKMSAVLANEAKEREFIMETRKKKLDLDSKKYEDMKTFEMKKITLDEKRFNREEEERDLKKEHIKVQTSLEKNKALLVKMEIFKMRQALKKADPSITDEFLNEQFPY
jgi:hypothetical protein